MLAAEERVSAIFAALADPTRRAILGRLAHEDLSVSELAEPFDMTHQGISRHLKVLEDAGLISRRQVRQSRPRHIEPEGFEPVIGWIEENRRLWAERYDRLDQHIARLRDGTPSRENRHDQ